MDLYVNEIKQNYIEKQVYGENHKDLCKEYQKQTYLPLIIIEFTSL